MRPRRLLPAAFFACAALVAGCGAGGGFDGVRVPKSDGRVYRGAVLFNQHCSGCHTISAANTQGSRPEGNVNVNERTNGPNFNVRRENREDVLYAIRNGGFSGAIMPANVVVGHDAQDIALFLERYAGSKSTSQPTNSFASSASSSGSK